MLRLLHIENIAVIEQAEIVFEDGFNVMTGETGRGQIDRHRRDFGHFGRTRLSRHDPNRNKPGGRPRDL